MSKNVDKREKLSTEAYKGVRDFYPEDQAFLTYFMQTIRTLVERIGYVEYHASILEPAELYKNKGAENEEMVNEQTYTFIDRGGREVTLRPEMTPTVARMVAAKRRELGYPLRLYSIPNLFRYERPQRGRLREHWQLNVDLFGSHSLAADAEVLAVAYGVMLAFGAKESDFVIKVSSRKFLDGIVQQLGGNEEVSKKLRRLLDAKAKMSGEEFSTSISELGVTSEMLSPEHPPEEIGQMVKDFKAAGIGNIEFDPSIVRGFDYYTGMVFEVFDTHPDNNRSLFGGGRYDNLTALFDDEPIPGVGFGMGDATMHNFLESRALLPTYRPPTHVYFAIPSSDLALQAQTFAGELRRAGVNVAVDFGEKKLADQIKTASKHKIPYLVVAGQDELATGKFVVRDLDSGAETALAREELPAFFLKPKQS